MNMLGRGVVEQHMRALDYIRDVFDVILARYILASVFNEVRCPAEDNFNRND